MNSEEYIRLVDQAYGTLDVDRLRARLNELKEQAKAENGEDSSEYIVMLNELGTFERGQYRFEEAESCFSEALGAAEKVFGALSGNYATTLNNLAGTHRMAGDYAKAEQEFFRTMDIYRQTVGEDHLLYASALNNLGLVYISQGRTDEAVDYLKRSTQIVGSKSGARSEYATSLANTGALLLRVKRYEEAAQFLSEARAIYENELDVSSNHYHIILNSLGLAYYGAGDKEKARETWEKAAECVKKLYGTEHHEYQSIMENLKLV